MIGFLIPLESEMKEFVPILANPIKEQLKGRTLIHGSIGTHSVVAMLSGYAKIRTAASTQFLIDHFQCDLIIHFGSAGALAGDIKIGDFILGKEILEHDYHEQFGGKQYKHPNTW